MSVLISRLIIGFIDNQTPWLLEVSRGLTIRQRMFQHSGTMKAIQMQNIPVMYMVIQLEPLILQPQLPDFVCIQGNYLGVRELVSVIYSLLKNCLKTLLYMQKLQFSITGQNLGYLTSARTVSPKSPWDTPFATDRHSWR